jgi:hypothetical protein
LVSSSAPGDFWFVGLFVEGRIKVKWSSENSIEQAGRHEAPQSV